MNLSAKAYRTFPLLLLILLLSTTSYAQGSGPTRQTVERVLDDQPYFSIHKDNYFISGAPTNKAVTSSTADAKYQVSFKQILARRGLPFDSYLFLTYTQKAFWDLYKSSLPFVDINFNPSFALGKLVYNRQDELKGIAVLSLEHESNGRDSIFSRTWNRLSFEYVTPVGERTTISAKAWLPWDYSEGNADYLEYVGLGEVNLYHEIKRDKAYFSVMAGKGLNLEAKGMVRSRFYYSPFKRNRSNQYIMLEYYLGQAESMLEYRQSRSVLRIGYVIRKNEYEILRRRMLD